MTQAAVQLRKDYPTLVTLERNSQGEVKVIVHGRADETDDVFTIENNRLLKHFQHPRPALYHPTGVRYGCSGHVVLMVKSIARPRSLWAQRSFFAPGTDKPRASKVFFV